MREAAAWLTSPIITMKYASTAVVNTSKNASTHMWMTAQRQKSAMTKLVSGVATKPETNSTSTQATQYSSHFGSIHASPERQIGATARAITTHHSANTRNSIACHKRPCSTNSQPWLPSRCHHAPNTPCGPSATPSRLPRVVTRNSANRAFTSRSWPAGAGAAPAETTKIEAPTQQALIHSRASCRCQPRTTGIGSA